MAFLACVFHLVNCLVLNIPFLVNMVAYTAFLPWRFCVASTFALRREQILAISAAGTITVTLVAMRLIWQGSVYAVVASSFGATAALGISAFAWAVVAGVFLYSRNCVFELHAADRSSGVRATDGVAGREKQVQRAA